MKRIGLLGMLLLIFQGKINAQDFTDETGNLPQLQMSIIAWGDYDGDGDLDLYLSGQDSNYNQTGKLYRNDNGTLTEVTGTGLPALTLGKAVWVD